MPTMREIKEYYGVKPNSKGKEAINAAIRKAVPGGAELLDVMTRLHEVQWGRAKPDPALQDMLDKLRTAREKMADYVIAQVKVTPAPETSKQNSRPETDRGVLLMNGDIADITPLLGTMPDTALAKMIGASHTYIAKKRRAAGIKPYSGAKPPIDWDRWDNQIINTENTAASIAARIGCDPSTVSERRRFLINNEGKYGKK